MSLATKRLLSLGLLLAVVALPAAAFAQVNIDDLRIGLVGGGAGGFVAVLNRVIRLILLIGGILAFAMVLYGGFLYLMAGGDSSKTAAAQKTITNAVIGIILIAISYALVVFVTGVTRPGGQLNRDAGAATTAPTPTPTPTPFGRP